MNIIKPNVEKIEINTPGKKIEYCGRVCYKSDSKINDDSYIRFISNIVKSGHYSVIEHERVCFSIDTCHKLQNLVNSTKYFTITYSDTVNYVSANIRAWYENIDSGSMFYPYLQELYPYIFTEEPLAIKNNKTKVINPDDLSEFHRDFHKNVTFKITCSRSCSHQFVRHRVLIFSQESQRYCNYTNEKFGKSINFILPEIDDVKTFTDEEKESIYNLLIKNFENTETEYFALIANGVRAEDARCILPNATATTLMVTGTINDWKHFFILRCDSHAQREIRDLANKIKEMI